MDGLQDNRRKNQTMNAQQYAIATTEKEIAQAYIDFHRMLTLGRSHEAVKQAIRLANQNEISLWNYLREYASSQVNYRETTPLLVVKVLSDNWQAEKNPVFVAQAVLTLVHAPKNDSIAKFLP